MPFVSQANKGKAAQASQNQVTPKGGDAKKKEGFDWKLLLIPVAILVMGLLALGALRARAMGKAGEASGVVKAAADVVAKPVQAVAQVTEQASSKVVEPVKQAAKYYFGLD